jgi:UPF0042 nucleotide-binding protein
MELVIVTGLSGAGRRSVLGILEDISYIALDNVPAQLLEALLEVEAKLNSGRLRLAVGMDNRHSDFAAELIPLVDRLAQNGVLVYIIFVEADENTLIRRFSEARRPHFLANTSSLIDGLTKEKNILDPIRSIATAVIDTSSLSLLQLRQYIVNMFPNIPLHRVTLHLMSFGFKYGIPNESDMVIDARFLPNPYYVTELREFTGKNQEVQDYLLTFDVVINFLDTIENWIMWSWPYIQNDGRLYHNIAIGCTGGQHRSVAMVIILAQRLQKTIYNLTAAHKQLGG